MSSENAKTFYARNILLRKITKRLGKASTQPPLPPSLTIKKSPPTCAGFLPWLRAKSGCTSHNRERVKFRPTPHPHPPGQNRAITSARSAEGEKNESWLEFREGKRPPHSPPPPPLVWRKARSATPPLLAQLIQNSKSQTRTGRARSETTSIRKRASVEWRGKWVDG